MAGRSLAELSLYEREEPPGGSEGETLECCILSNLPECMQEAGRLFCSKCGNAALQKVEVVIGTDGTEQFGVRKKHIIRGTKFPLPKPHVRPTNGTPPVVVCMTAALTLPLRAVPALVQLSPCTVKVP